MNKLGIISPFIEQLWRAIQDSSHDFFVLDARLANVIRNLDLSKRRSLFARFLLYAEKERGRLMMGLNKVAFPPYWPHDIQEVINEARAIDQNQQIIRR